MDKNAYPDISKLIPISIQNTHNDKITLGELTLNNISYFAMYIAKKDILELSSFNKKYMFTPTDPKAETKYVLIVDRDSNLEITLDIDNNIVNSTILERGNYGIHFK